jgi:hypothetical protein
MNRLVILTALLIVAGLGLNCAELSTSTAGYGESIEIVALKDQVADMRREMTGLDRRVQNLELQAIIRDQSPPATLKDENWKTANEAILHTASQKGWLAALQQAVDPVWQMEMHLSMSQAAALCRAIEPFANPVTPAASQSPRAAP